MCDRIVVDSRDWTGRKWWEPVLAIGLPFYAYRWWARLFPYLPLPVGYLRIGYSMAWAAEVLEWGFWLKSRTSVNEGEIAWRWNGCRRMGLTAEEMMERGY